MSKTKAVDIWLCDLTYSQQTIAADSIPFAIGGIATYLEKLYPQVSPVKLFKYPERLIEALEQGQLPNIIGFSNYVWNFSLSNSFCAAIKKRAPKIVSVFGGPNIPLAKASQVSFLKKYPHIDFAVIKEGEIPFAALLECLVANDFDIDSVKKIGCPSVVSEPSGQINESHEITRIKNLDEIPSPYLAGKLDEFFDGKLMPLIQTNRGCPFTCTFCVEGGDYYNKINRNTSGKVESEIDYIGRRMREQRAIGGRNDLFIADSNFGMYSTDKTVANAIAKAQKVYEWPDYINVATGKNKKEKVLEVAGILNGTLRLSGSVQSLDLTVLENIKRKNISSDGLMALALDANRIGANSYCEIILGLPGETKTTHESTVRTVMEASFNNIFLFQLMLLDGSELATEKSRETYEMTTRYRVLPRCYGHYQLWGDNLLLAEIEEICVSTNTLSFQDYLDCRLMHLMVSLFYNDGLFGNLLKLIRLRGLSPWRWIEILMTSMADKKLQKMFSDFRQSTQNELWLSKEDLLDFVNSADTIESFLAGRLGNNLLFTYKSRAIVNYSKELANLARDATCVLFREQHALDDETMELVEDCAKYHQCQMTGLFSDVTCTVTEKFRFDLLAFEQSETISSLESFRFTNPEEVNFELTLKQQEILEKYSGLYGMEPEGGVARILSKVYVKKLFRHGLFPSNSLNKNLSPEADLGEVISGLQN